MIAKSQAWKETQEKWKSKTFKNVSEKFGAICVSSLFGGFVISIRRKQKWQNERNSAIIKVAQHLGRRGCYANDSRCFSARLEERKWIQKSQTTAQARSQFYFIARHNKLFNDEKSRADDTQAKKTRQSQSNWKQSEKSCHSIDFDNFNKSHR